MNHALHMNEIRRVRIGAQFPERPPSLEKLIAATGLHRTLGGVDVYLALRARLPSFRADDLHRALLDGTLTVGPTVRGCIYLGLASDRSLMLGVAALLARTRLEKELQKVKVAESELQRLADLVAKTLSQSGPLSTDGLRKSLPQGAVRNLGDQGKKIGISSTLPPTLRLLEFDGRIKRVPESGRVDVERYAWSSAEPFESIPREVLVQRLAERFFAWAGLATIDSFAEWSGLGKREARAAADALDLTSWDCGGLGCLGDRAVVDRALASDAAVIALLPFEDNLVALAGGLSSWFEVSHHEIKLPNWGGSGSSTIGESRYAMLRPLLAEGRFIGFWEFEPRPQTVVLGILDKVTKRTRSRIEEEAERTKAFLHESFDHARSFSLDTDAELARRCALVRKLGQA